MTASHGKPHGDNKTVVWSEAGLELRPGDAVRLACDYDTRERSKATSFGAAAEEEMCNAFLSFYRLV